MGRVTYLVSIVVLVASMMISGSKASHHELCLDQMVNFTEIEFIALGECVKEYAPPEKLADGVTESPDSIRERIKKAKEHKCMEACFMCHKGMFVDGKFNMENSKKFIEEFPETVRKDLSDSLVKCSKLVEHKTLKVDNKECAEFAEFIKCVDDDENKICKRTD